MPQFTVTHQTTYQYESRVSSSYGQLCMLPRDFPGQTCLGSSLAIEPTPGDVRERADYFGNRVSYFAVDQPHDLLRLTAKSTVQIDDNINAISETNQPSLSAAVASLDDLKGFERTNAAQFLTPSPRIQLDAQVRGYAEASFAPDRPAIECVEDLSQRIHRDFRFNPTTTTVTSTVADLFTHGAGVCQDFAHLAVACFRAQGLPARYVSGYLETDPPPGKQKVFGADVSHAWTAVFIAGSGWIAIDPTNDQFVNERYVTTSWGRDYSDISPLKGVIFSNGGKTELAVSVDVSRAA